MTIEETAHYLKTHDRFVLASHQSPDADGLGAQYALTLVLRSMGKQAYALNADPYSDKYRFIDQRRAIDNLEASQPAPGLYRDCVLVLLDTNDIHYTGNIAVLAKEESMQILVIDHHEPDPGSTFLGLSVQDASSTCELVYRLIETLGQPLDSDTAQALYTGIVYDTGSFAYSKTSPLTLRIAAQLLSCGVRAEQVHRSLYESSSVPALLLRKEVLASLELFLDDRVAIQTMTLDCLRRTGASFIDAEDLINIPMQCKSVEISVLLKETEQGQVRCSLRGKGLANMASIAQTFGGGGHKNAAGFRSPWPLADLKLKMLSLLGKSLGQPG